MTAYTLIAISLLLGTPFFIFFGWLSDKIGRLKIILAGCIIAAVTYFPLFQALTHYVNPALEAFQAKTPITVTADPATATSTSSSVRGRSSRDCDKAKDFLTKAGLSFTSVDAAGRIQAVKTTIGDTELAGFDDAKFNETLKAQGLFRRRRTRARSTGA